MEETMDTTEGMTLKEASNTFCPIIAAAAVAEGMGSLCSGVNCMMWRWKGYSDTFKEKSKGYCGLAGKP